MFNKTDMAKSGDTQNQGSFISSQKIADSIVQLPSKLKNQTVNQYWNRVVTSCKQLSLGTKATVLAIALGTLPVLTIGAIAYNLVNKSITRQITQSQQAEAIGLTDKVNRLMLGRYADIQVLSNLPFLTNSQIGGKINYSEKQALLDRIVNAYKTYDSIAVFDLEGKRIVQSTGEALNNQQDFNYFQETIQKDSPVISKLEKAQNAIYIAAPVKDIVTDKTIAVLRAQMPMQSVEEAIKNYAANGQKYYLLDNSGKVLLSSQKELLGKDAKVKYPGLAKLVAANQVGSLTQKSELVSYVPPTKLEGLPQLNWQVLLTADTAVLFEPQRQLLWTIAIGTALTAAITGAIAAWLSNRTIQPIKDAIAVLEKLGKGELNTRVEEIQRTDELGLLSTNLNHTAEEFQILLQQRTFVAVPSDEERQQKEALQMQLVELLSNVEGVANGDLTVRADVTAGEIGTVADFFNSIVENLRDIVTQVKQAANQLNNAIGSNEGAIRQLAEDALIQTAEINRTLDAVDVMNNSMQSVAESAQKAAVVANHAAQTATKSGQAMDLTVHNILSLRETVSETAKKVKRLGESSQQISRVVFLINQIATQTNLLAINAGIEAARAGEEGQGFAVVAEEIGELAARSATATQEIEHIVDNIQRETNEVVQAMEIGTTQVVEGTRIVEEAKQSLGQILEVSRQIDSLVQSISTATTSQLKTSQTVNQLMQDVAAVSQRTSDSSSLVSQSLQQTLEISHQLQETVGTFKVS